MDVMGERYDNLISFELPKELSGRYLIGTDVAEVKERVANFCISPVQEFEVEFENNVEIFCNNFEIMEDYVKKHHLENEVFCQGKKVEEAVTDVVWTLVADGILNGIRGPEKFYDFVKTRYAKRFNESFSLPSNTVVGKWHFYFNSKGDRYTYACQSVALEIKKILKDEGRGK